MKIKQYAWVFFWFAAAILIAFAITTIASKTFLVYAFGCVFLIFGVFRIVPLVKTTDSKLVKWLTVAEILIDVLAGVGMIAFAEEVKDAEYLIGYVVGVILYLRGFMHFLATSFKGEPTDFISLITNIALITVATVIISQGGFNYNALKWFFFVLALVCAAFLIFRGAKDYRNYRGNLTSISKTKKIKVSETKEAETNPTSDEIKINIVPEDKPKKEERIDKID